MGAQDRVQEALDRLGLRSRVVEFSESTETAGEAAAAVGCSLGQIVKTLFFLADGRPTIVLMAGDRQADMGKLAAIVGVPRKRLKMGSPGEVVAHTGFVVGGVSPVGLANPCDVVMDESLARFERVWAAAGARNAVFEADRASLAEAIGGQWADLARESA